MGIADMLIKLGIRYGSEDAIELNRDIAITMANAALEQSARLAQEFGAYPKMKDTEEILWSDYIQYNATDYTKEMIKKYGLRNSQVLTIAPTGSISTMLEISGGIEPIFSYQYQRKTESLHGSDVYYTVYTKIVKDYIKANNLESFDNLPDYFINSMSLNPYERVDMQAVWQDSIDASISSTVNLPNEATVEDVYNIYMYSYDKGLKGCTVYRAGCKREGILVEKPKETSTPVETIEKVIPAMPLEQQRGVWCKIPEDTLYIKRKLQIGCGKLMLFIGYSLSEDAVVDFYVKRSGNGGCERSIETTCIAMSGMLRLGGDLFNIQKAFEGVGGCNSFATARAKGRALSRGNTCGTAMLYELLDFEKQMHSKITKEEKLEMLLQLRIDDVIEYDSVLQENVITSVSVNSNPKQDRSKAITGVPCPSCGEPLINSGGCIECRACGYTKCD